RTRDWFAAAMLIASPAAAQPVDGSAPPAATTTSTAPGEPSPVRGWQIQQDALHAALMTMTPAIVRIDTVGGVQAVPGESPAGPVFRAADGPTTGVIWSSDGLIVTSAFNFMRDPSIITVTFADGRRL